LATGKKIYRLPGHGRLGGRRAVAFTPHGKAFLAWGDDMYLRKWGVGTGKALLEHLIRPTGIRVFTEDDEPMQRELFFNLGNGIFTPDGKYFVLQAGAKFFVFDVVTGKELRSFPSEGSSQIGMAISPDSKIMVATAYGKYVETKLPNGSTQSTVPKNHSVTWWDLATGKVHKQILLPEQGVGPVAFSPDVQMFAVASSQPSSRIRLMETATGREVRRIDGFHGVVRSLAFMPDGKRLVSGMDDSSALVWDLAKEVEK
jgi:WD40 repeat protein